MADGKIKISELEEALQLSDNAEFPYAQDNGGVPTTFKAPANQIARKVAEGSTFTNLETTAKTLVGAINELSHLGNPILLGTTAPTSSQGANGNLYIQYTEGTGGASDTVDSIYAKIDGAWCEIETGGGGASTVSQLTDVLLSATIPDGDVLVRDNNLTGGKLWKNKTITVELTQAEYDQLVADDEVLPDVDYYITDAPSMQGTSADLSYDGTTLSTHDKIEGLNASNLPITSGSVQNTKDYIDTTFYTKAEVDNKFTATKEWKTSTTSFVDACSKIGIFQGIGNVLENLKTNISDYTANNISTRVDSTQGPVYFMWFGKASDQYFTGILLTYFGNSETARKAVYFSYFNGTYQVRLL